MTKPTGKLVKETEIDCSAIKPIIDKSSVNVKDTGETPPGADQIGTTPTEVPS